MKKNSFEELREKMIASAKEGIKEKYSSEEYSLIQAINAYDETSKLYNLAYERLTEWYGIYFPELKVSSAAVLADLASGISSSEPPFELVQSLVKEQERAEQIHAKILSNIGRRMNPEEAAAVASFGGMMKSVTSTMQELDVYIKGAANKLLPNVVYLTDDKIAAELLSKAGSMEKLANMPASTVQLLGAEKALFKHIKFGSKPPKYGVLFKLPEINGAQRDQRGRIARVYATKICIALKADFYTKNFIAKKLKEDLERIVKAIKSSPSKPKPAQKEWKGRPQGGRPPQRGRGGRPQQRQRWQGNRGQ